MAKKPRHSNKKLLDQAVRLARDVLRDCAHHKTCRSYHFWVFTLLAKAAASACSIQILVDKGQVDGCFMIGRSLCDDVISIDYILHDYRKSEQLVDLLQIENAIDAYEDLQVEAETQGKTLEQFVAEDPQRKRVLAEWQKAKKDPAFGASAKQWPKRWKRIGVNEKLKATSDTERTALHKYFTSSLGNAFAHARPMALRHFFQMDAEGAIRFLTRPLLGMCTRGALLGLAAVQLVYACNLIIEKYYLSEGLRNRARGIGRDLAPNSFRQEED